VIRVFVIAPALAVRVGFRGILQAEAGILVVGEASHLDEITDPVDADVILLAPGGENIIVPGSVHDIGQTAILLVSNQADLNLEMLVSSAQGWGILLPEVTQEELGIAIRAVAEGLIVGAPLLIQRMLRSEPERDANKSKPAILTGREVEVLQLMAQGLANKQIAIRLDISPHTVKFHIASIYTKLNATSRTEAVRLGYQNGLIIL